MVDSRVGVVPECGGELHLISTWVWRRALLDLYMGMEESFT
jgi:hypothetical protein